MIEFSRIQSVFTPIAADILEADANAVADIVSRRTRYEAYDFQPSATAMATERRAAVATALRAKVGPSVGWELNAEAYESGGYEWVIDGGEVVRLAKTTPESRRHRVFASAGIQDTLFTQPKPIGGGEILLIRLNGNPLHAASVDVVNIDPTGKPWNSVDMKHLAELAVSAIPRKAPPKPTVGLPDHLRIRRDTDTDDSR